jgi:uncharacterized protein (DUF488 family)
LIPTSSVWMIGHSNHSGSRFVELLRIHGIQAVIDIRTNARSRFPQFNQKALIRLLGEHSVTYQHAPLLGGRSPLPDNEIARELQNHLPTKGRTSFLCSEGDPLECHRHTLVAPAVRRLGYSVFQILRDGTIWEDR